MRTMGIDPPPRSPVLSLTILDSSTLAEGIVQPDTKVLVVARSAETNKTHPHVVSVPTQRIPQALNDAIVSAAGKVGDDPTSGTAYFRQPEVNNQMHNDHQPLISAVESIMARKLGLADALEREELSFRASLRTRIDGTALYDNLSDSADFYERVSMLNAIVEVRDDRTVLPVRTSSYSVVAWTSVKSFLEGVDRSDSTAIGPEFDPLTFCVHGVCLQAAQASLKHLIGHAVSAEKVTSIDPLYLIPDGPYVLPYEGTMTNPPS